MKKTKQLKFKRNILVIFFLFFFIVLYFYNFIFCDFANDYVSYGEKELRNTLDKLWICFYESVVYNLQKPGGLNPKDVLLFVVFGDGNVAVYRTSILVENMLKWFNLTIEEFIVLSDFEQKRLVTDYTKHAIEIIVKECSSYEYERRFNLKWPFITIRSGCTVEFKDSLGYVEVIFFTVYE